MSTHEFSTREKGALVRPAHFKFLGPAKSIRMSSFLTRRPSFSFFRHLRQLQGGRGKDIGYAWLFVTRKGPLSMYSTGTLGMYVHWFNNRQHLHSLKSKLTTYMMFRRFSTTSLKKRCCLAKEKLVKCSQENDEKYILLKCFLVHLFWKFITPPLNNLSEFTR